MSALIDALNLTDSQESCTFASSRISKPRNVVLRKDWGWCDDELYARNLWPCRDHSCLTVLGPMDAVWEVPKTVEEVNAEESRCCPSCGTFRSKGSFC